MWCVCVCVCVCIWLCGYMYVEIRWRYLVSSYIPPGLLPWNRVSLNWKLTIIDKLSGHPVLGINLTMSPQEPGLQICTIIPSLFRPVLEILSKIFRFTNQKCFFYSLSPLNSSRIKCSKDRNSAKVSTKIMSKDKISTDLVKCYGFCFDKSWCMKYFYFGAVITFFKKKNCIQTAS